MMKGIDDDQGPEVALRQLMKRNFGVLGYIIINKTGIPVQFHGMDQAKALHFAASVSELTRSTRDFLSDVHKRTMDPHNDAELKTLRLRTFKHEIIIAPEDVYTLIVIHNRNWVEEEAVEEEGSDTEGMGGTSPRSSRQR